MSELRGANRSVLVRLTDEQLDRLRTEAGDAGLPVTQLIELRVFGEIRPRVDPRAPRHRRPKGQLSLEIEEEPAQKSA